MKIFMAIIVVLILSACTSISRAAIVRSSDSNNTEWPIFVKANNGAFSDQISIYINGKEVMNGTISVLQTRKNFSGIYEGRKIDAECSLSKDGGIMLGHKCMIYIDSKQISELSF